jgi:FkbM family methyltransferase
MNAQKKKLTSNAQNCEDIILWRALGNIKNGFYIDIGAQDPVNDSVSRAFYEIGWRGVHFEPTPAYAQKLRENRPDEKVYEVALSDREGELEFYQSIHSGVSTGVVEYASKNRLMGIPVESTLVPMSTLSRFGSLFVGKEVHWMKIDVEGMEEQVLRGWDSAILRPWVIVVESTLPNTRVSNHQNWEHFLISSSYKFVYFDGLNRFYVADEHSNLKEAFSAPVNIFDAIDGWQLAPANLFITNLVSLLNQTEAGAVAAEKRAVAAEERAVVAEERAAVAEERAAVAVQHANKCIERITEIESSRFFKCIKNIESIIKGNYNTHK